MLGSLNLRKFLLFAGDLTLLYASLLLTVMTGFFRYQRGFSWNEFIQHLLPFSILYFFWLVIFYIFGLYDINATRIRVVIYPKILWALFCSLGLGMIFFYLMPAFKLTPRINLALDIVIFGVLFFVWRRLFYSLFSSRFFNNVAILGKDRQKIDALAKEIAARPYLGYKLVAVFDDGKNLLARIQENKINTLIVAEDFETDFDLLENLYRCLEAKINFMDWSQAYELLYEKIPVSSLDKKWFLTNLKEGEKKVYDQVKKWSDVVLSAIILIATLPLWPIIALFIKLDDGEQIFYRQERIGKNGKPFFLLKFRSMEAGAEDKTGPVWADEKDPRITAVGRILRKSHLDEIPQMINVLRGDISLVGPRPERPEFVMQLEKEIPHYNIRHLIVPGFTGWAQLKFRYGRSIMDAKEKFQYDLYYLKNRSFFLDLGILLKTFQLFFRK